MHISEVFKKYETTLSFEFFPVKTQKGSEQLFSNILELVPLRPTFVSVTYGAGGSTRQFTDGLITQLKKETSLPIVPHLTCVGQTKEELFEVVKKYVRLGIENLMVLRGDPPEGEAEFGVHPGGLKYAAELVAMIKKDFDHIGIGVAGFPEGHPETPNRLKEMDYLKAKVDAGADYICTQLFFDNHDFYDFCERCELAGIKVPIIAGIMPVTTMKGMYRMAELALGTRFPAKLLRALSRADGDEYIEKIGVHWATEQVSDLIDNGAKGIHFYTLNRSQATKNIYESIGLKDSDSLLRKV